MHTIENKADYTSGCEGVRKGIIEYTRTAVAFHKRLENTTIKIDFICSLPINDIGTAVLIS